MNATELLTYVREARQSFIEAAVANGAPDAHPPQVGHMAAACAVRSVDRRPRGRIPGTRTADAPAVGNRGHVRRAQREDASRGRRSPS